MQAALVRTELAVTILLLLAPAVGGCGASYDVDKPSINEQVDWPSVRQLEFTKAYGESPTYWLGPTHEKLPVTEALVVPPFGSGVSIDYGGHNCDAANADYCREALSVGSFVDRRERIQSALKGQADPARCVFEIDGRLVIACPNKSDWLVLAGSAAIAVHVEETAPRISPRSVVRAIRPLNRLARKEGMEPKALSERDLANSGSARAKLRRATSTN